MDATLLYSAPKIMHWDWRIAADLFFGGIGVGAFLLAVFNEAYNRIVFRLAGKVSGRTRNIEITRLAAWASPFFLVIGLLFLVSELGHPMRMWMTIPSFNPTSPMSWGGIFQGAMIVIGILYARSFDDNSTDIVPRQVLVWLGVPVALIVGAYHGFLLTVVRAHPLWNTGPATVTAILAFITTGIAMVTLLLCLHARSEELLSSIQFIRIVLGIALVGQVFANFIWWVSLRFGPQNARDALETANAYMGPVFWYGAIGIGLIIPIILGVFSILHEHHPGSKIRREIIVATSLMILIGGYIFRYAILIGGQLS